jgi:hypothetical protein
VTVSDEQLQQWTAEYVDLMYPDGNTPDDRSWETADKRVHTARVRACWIVGALIERGELGGYPMSDLTVLQRIVLGAADRGTLLFIGDRFSINELRLTGAEEDQVRCLVFAGLLEPDSYRYVPTVNGRLAMAAAQ